MQLLANVIVLSLQATLALAERRRPAVPAWLPNPDLSSDLLLAALTLSLYGLSGLLPLPTLPPWTSPWPLQVALALLIADLPKYWLHRLSHEVPWLWRFHAAHHSPARMDVLNGLRFHPVNTLWNLAADLTPLLLGAPPLTVALASAIRGGFAALQHANLPLPASWLDRWLSTPALHRWHHSADPSEGNANYAALFSFWDRLFGTWLRPDDRPRPDALGLPDAPVSACGQLLWPFLGARLTRCR